MNDISKNFDREKSKIINKEMNRVHIFVVLFFHAQWIN